MAEEYIDLKIADGDLVFANGVEALVSNKESIAQDIRHAIMESGTLITLIGERNAEKRQQKINQLIEYLETDPRIIPGSITASFVDQSQSYLFMDTVQGKLELAFDNTRLLPDGTVVTESI